MLLSSVELQVHQKSGTATFGLPRSKQEADPTTHALLQQSHIHYTPKTWLKELGYYPDTVYEIHISVHPDLQGKGYAAKMIRALARLSVHPLWVMKARIVNPQVLSVVEKLKKDPLLSVTEIEYDGDLQGWVVKLGL